MSIKYNSIIPSGGGSGSDPTKLPLTGGTLTGNLIIDTSAGSAGYYEASEMYVTRTDADTGAGESNAYGALYNGGVDVGDIDGKYAVLTPNRLRLGNTTSLEKGSFDSGRGGDFGISLICTNNVELNWQSGYLKAKYNGSFVPINVESDLVNSTIPDIDNQGTKSIFNSYGLSVVYYTGSEDTFTTNYGNNGINHTFFDNPQNFHLNSNGVYGTSDSPISWGIEAGGVGASDSDNNSFGLNFGGVGGLINETWTWGIGVSGAGGDNDDRQYWNVGTNGYSAEYEYNTCSLNSLGVQGFDNNTEGTWSFGLNGATFANGTVINSPSTQNASIPYTLYDKEVVITINGVTYAMLARIV